MKAFILFIMILLLSSCGRSDAKNTMTNEKKTVSVLKIEKKDYRREFKSFGYVSNKKEIRLSFKIPGIVEEIYVTNGDYVKKGQLLATLNLTEINARLEQSHLEVEKLERDLERLKKLRNENVATLEQIQNMESAYLNAKAKNRIARYNKLHSKIIAPDNGYILGKFVESGELVQAGHPIFYYGKSTESYSVKLGLSDKDILILDFNDSAYISFDAYPGKLFKASIIELAAAANPKSGLFDLELLMEQTSVKFLSGMIAKVRILSSKVEKEIIIPFSALLTVDGSKGTVFVYEAGNAELRKIRYRLNFKGDVIVTKGIEAGDSLIVKGNDKLSDGDDVNAIMERSDIPKGSEE